jgi:hypothetical protein
MNRILLAMALLATLAITIAVHAQPRGQAVTSNKLAPPEAVTPYHFLDAVIGSLSQAHDALTEINAQKDGDFFGKMVALKNANVEFDIASRRLQPFGKSGTENVRSASEGMVTAFGYIREAFAIQLATYETLNVATSVEQVAATRGPMSDAAVKYRQSSKVLLDAAGIAVASAVIADPKDPVNHVALMMSATEKAALIKTLKSRFGGKLATTNGNTGPMSAAKVMLNALDQDWRLAK